MKEMFEFCLPITDHSNTIRRMKWGMEWEAEVTACSITLEVSLWCNRRAESNVWLCEARVSISSSDGNTLREALVKYHSRNRKHTFVLNRSEAEHEVVLKFEICNVIGYREPELYRADFTKPSVTSDVCFSFRDTERRLYANSQFLSIHSPYFAQRFAKLLSNNHGNVLCCANDYQSEHFTDLEVISNGSTGTAQSHSEVEKCFGDAVEFIRIDKSPSEVFKSPSTAGGAELQLCDLEDVDFEEFRILLEAIYPPGCEIDEGTLRPLLHLSHKFSIDHVVRRCELYLKSEQGSSCFDLFTRLELATAYKLADLQEKCLRMLTSASSVRDLLDDPRLENASSDIRTILLEAFLRRCTKGVSGNDGFVGEAVSTNEERKMSPSSTDVTVTEEKPEYLDDNNNNVPDDRDLELDPAHSSEPSLHEQLIREIGVRKNLEMSLKCMRDFILNSEMKQPKWARPNVVEDELLGSLEERVSRLESIRSGRKPEPAPAPTPPIRDPFKEVVFDTFDATKLSKDRYVTCNQKVFSMYDIFHDFVLEPYSSTECATYAFVSHFFIKPYGELVVPLLNEHNAGRVNAFPENLIEQVASSMIAGYNLGEQLQHDAFLVHELAVALQKQMRKDFDVLCFNMKAVQELVE
ncbi:hypothetical protein Q1695_008887 [Nippostrongylus brasiliensis]|nr:hypothetical protein Q1695_008887 [Nippostrongylus brasiliensis]